MPKVKDKESVVYDWVSHLTFQQQALLMTGMRGPDGSDKHNAAKCIVRYVRGVVLKPAGNWNFKNNNDFMWGDFEHPYFEEYTDEFWANHDHYPHHFIMHLLHACEVIGYKHPNELISKVFARFYLKGCLSFHMLHESEMQMDGRLSDFK